MVECQPNPASRLASKVDPTAKARAKDLIIQGLAPKEVASITGLNYASLRVWAPRWKALAKSIAPPSQPSNAISQRVTIGVTQTVSRHTPSRARDSLTQAVETLADRVKVEKDLDLACSSVDRLARAGKNLELWSGANSIVETTVGLLYEQAAQSPAQEQAAIDVESKASPSEQH